MRKLVRGIEDALQGDGEGVDVVHVFGGAAWRLAEELAAEMKCGLAVEVWRYGLCERAAEWDFARPGAPTLMAPDGTIERQLKKVAPRARVVHDPWGVLPADARDIFKMDRSWSVMMVGTGRDAAAFSAALTGLAPVLAQHPGVLVFCDAHAAQRAELWAVARRLNILDRLSLIEDLEGRRDLLLQGDVLVHPEASGEQRSILLEAMAHGVVVVAARDPQVSTLVEGRSARLVEGADAGAWKRVLGEVLGDPAGARSLALAAQAFVREQRKASGHVRAVIGAYEAIAAGRAADAPTKV